MSSSIDPLCSPGCGSLDSPRGSPPAASRAQRPDFDRGDQHLKIPDSLASLEDLIKFRNLEVEDTAAFDADQMMMRREVAVVARAVMKRGHFSRLANLAQRFERAMDGGQRE